MCIYISNITAGHYLNATYKCNQTKLELMFFLAHGRWSRSREPITHGWFY